MSQPNDIKEKATTPDQLISLYFKHLKGEASRPERSDRSDLISRTDRASERAPERTSDKSSERSAERPSVQNFKSELKNLVGMMGDLDGGSASHGPSAPPHVAPPSSSHTNSANSNGSGSAYAAHPQASMQSHASTGPLPHATPSTSSTSPGSAAHQQSYFQTATPHLGFQPAIADLLDPRSLSAVREARILFNLSADDEAVRMLLAIGMSVVKSKLLV